MVDADSMSPLCEHELTRTFLPWFAAMPTCFQLGRHRRSRASTHTRLQPHPTTAPQQQLQPPQLSWAAVRRENAAGRDFTVNCLMYDPFAGLLYDYVGGVPDLQARLLRCNGDPHSRFSRDPACMLRAVRCAARAGEAL